MNTISTYTKQVEQSRRFQAKRQGLAFNGKEPAGNGTLFNGVAFEQRNGDFYAKSWDGSKVLHITVVNGASGWLVQVNGELHYTYPTRNEALESASLYCK